MSEEDVEAPRRLGPARTAAIGALAGFASGLLGIGGGLVMVPLLTLWARAPIHRAVGTSLLGVLVLATSAVLTELFVAPANVRWLPAALLAAGAVCGSFVGARLAARTTPRALSRLMAALLVVAALKMSGLLPLSPGLEATEPTGALMVVLHLVAGLAAGIISALFGVGGGILAVPLLALLHPAWSFQAARATSLAMIIPTATAGALFHRKLKNVDGRLAASLLPAALVGVVAGVLLANAVPGRPLEVAFAALLVVAAVRLARR